VHLLRSGCGVRALLVPPLPPRVLLLVLQLLK